MTKTITENFPQRPVDETSRIIADFWNLDDEGKRRTIASLLSTHPVLSLSWGKGRRFRRARRLAADDPNPVSVDGVIWRKNGHATLGRANPEGYTVMYLSDRVETALREVRHESGSVVISEYEVVPGKSVRIAPIGELGWIQRTGLGRLAGTNSKAIIGMINACSEENAKSLLLVDAFLADLLCNVDDDYVISSTVAKCILDKNVGVDAIAYPSVRQPGAINFAIRIEHFWQKWGVSSVKQIAARHTAYGIYRLNDVAHVNKIAMNGVMDWQGAESSANIALLLSPLWSEGIQ